MRRPFPIFIGAVLFGGSLLQFSGHAQPAWFAGPAAPLDRVTDIGKPLPWGNGGSSAGLFDVTSFPLPSAAIEVTSQSAMSDEARELAPGRWPSIGQVPAEAHEAIHPYAGFWLYVGFWKAFRFFALFVSAVAGLTFAEWRWMIARQNELRALVKERTQELEAEKAELLRTKAALVQLAGRDPLTGLFSRAAIFEVLEYEVELARRAQGSFALVLADLDHFKRINDTHGHLVGDEVLREFARRIRANLRPSDNAGRFGGEEMLMLIRGLKDESTDRVGELHRQVTKKPFLCNGLVLRVTCSFGVAWFSGPLNTVESLLGLADQALYAAKANGRNRMEVSGRLCILPPGEADNGRRLSL